VLSAAINSDTSLQPLQHISVITQAWAHKIFIFRTENKIEISGHFNFSGHQSHKKTQFFVIAGTCNFGTFRAEAKITIRRHEVVYQLSSERKMIDLE